MSDKKYIICSGCSFTRQYTRIGLNSTDKNFLNEEYKFWRWPHHIKNQFSDLIVYNLGNPTNDNSVIAHSVIKKITDLLKNGVDSKNIKVIVQWSDQIRNSFFISKKTASNNNIEVIDRDNNDYSYNPKTDLNKWTHLSTFAENDHFEKRWGYYLLTGGYQVDHINYSKDLIQTYSKYVSEEESVIRFFTNIILLQNFCKLNGINDIFMFNLSYNFIIDIFPKTYRDIGKTYLEKQIPEFFVSFKSDNPYISYLYENIDLNNFWFYKNNNTNVGGQIEWAISEFNHIDDKILFMEHGYTEDDLIKFCKKNKSFNPIGHVSSEMNKKFVDTVLTNFLKN